jgi:hypothetical protein
VAGGQAWPGGLGPLESAGARYPARQSNAAASKLDVLAEALPKSEALDQFVQREMVRGELQIGEPPSLPDAAAIRDLLLGEQLVWAHEGGVVEVGSVDTSALRARLMTVARVLVASALARGRANDPAAWKDLEAVWNLARAVEAYPQMMLRTGSFSMARMINAVAWKMPMPVPDWFAGVQERDYVQPLVEAFQYQAAAYWADGSSFFPTKWLASSVEHDRQIAAQLLAETRCDVNAPANQLGVDLSFVWRRAFRYRAEREATARALRMREGKAIETKSACSDGSWTQTESALRFSRDIATTPPDTPMPLTLNVGVPAAANPGDEGADKP